MRPIWSGSINFGLINIPVKLYSAKDPKDLHFNLFRKSDMSPIRYKKVAEADEQEVATDEMVKAFEYEKGKFVPIEKEDFENANLEKSSSIKINSFSEITDVDPMYFEHPYYLEPEGDGKKAYELLRQTLEESGKVGIATYVLRNREHLAVLRSQGKYLQLNQLFFHNEVIEPAEIELDIKSRDEISKDEKDMAIDIINKMTKKFNPEKYEDTYQEELRHMIKQKATHHKITPKGERAKPTNTVDLMKKLKESLKAAS